VPTSPAPEKNKNTPSVPPAVNTAK
jgi:hypothetical protein